MRKKIFAFVVLLLLVPMLTAAFAQASPIKDKPNDKFETFSAAATFPFTNLLFADHQYIPSMDQVNLLVLTYDESFLTYEITIGPYTYQLGTDFAYTGQVVNVFHDVSAWLTIPNLIPPYLYPREYRSSMMKVDYTFNFSAYPGGIEGTLNMIGVFNQENSLINSLSGTGDLQNIQIKAVNEESTVVSGIVTIGHEGIVFGWPNIPPAA